MLSNQTFLINEGALELYETDGRSATSQQQLLAAIRGISGPAQDQHAMAFILIPNFGKSKLPDAAPPTARAKAVGRSGVHCYTTRIWLLSLAQKAL